LHEHARGSETRAIPTYLHCLAAWEDPTMAAAWLIQKEKTLMQLYDPPTEPERLKLTNNTTRC
jgi:hypothetical protein